ncbi:hypothetical protein KAH94_03570 [bacterium]|nr:hypothetical protein [bacterium]
MKTTFYKVRIWLLRFVQIQLFITTVSLPILLSWGLPISLLSIIGNLIFFPFLAIFLLLSSLIFFLELICIPNQLLIFLLESVSSWWVALMSFGSHKTFLIGFTQPSIFILILIPMLAFAILQNKKTNTLNRSVFLLFLLLLCSFSFFKLISSNKTVIESISCNGGDVSIIKSNKTTIIIDPGVIGKRISAPSWVEYTLAPQIIKSTGTTIIDHVIALQPSIMTFKALEKLCSILSIKKIYLPYWNGTLKKNGWRSFFFLKRAAEKKGTTIHSIGTYKKKIKLSLDNFITITPLKESLSYQDATYPVLQTFAYIDKQSFTFYSAKYKNEAQNQINNEIQ